MMILTAITVVTIILMTAMIMTVILSTILTITLMTVSLTTILTMIIIMMTKWVKVYEQSYIVGYGKSRTILLSYSVLLIELQLLSRKFCTVY